jgi:hypothetical protein
MKIYDITGIGANLTGSFSGSFKEIFTGTATTASYVQYSNVANKPTLVSGSTQITYSGISSKPAGIVSGSSQVLAFNVFATTGSNGFNGNQSITGSLTVTGQVIAQTLNVQQVTSSIVFSSGSNRFGNNSGNTHRFTGSVNITGSITSNGALNGTSGTFTGDLIAASATINTPANAIGILLNGRSADNVSQIRFGANSGGGAYNTIQASPTDLQINSQGNTPILFGTNLGGGGGTRMTISGAGAVTLTGALSGTSALFSSTVGIGTATSPAAELQVGKASDVTIAMSNSSSVTSGNRGSLAWYNSSVSTVANIRAAAVTDNVGTELQFFTRPAAGSLTQVLTLSSTGAATFSSSVTATQFVANGNSAGGFEGLRIINASTGAAQIALNNSAQSWLVNTRTDNHFSIFNATSSTTPFLITTGGNVGIGTASPTNGKLEIQQSTTAPALWVQTGGTTSASVIADFRTGTNLPALQILGNGEATFGSSVTASGNITSSNGKFFVVNTFGYFFGDNSNLTGWQGSNGTQIIQGFTGGTERMRITSGGNVGIGNTDPSAKLHINSTTPLRLTGGGITKQYLVNSKTAASSGTALKLFYVGFSHAVRLYLYILQDSSNVATAIADFTTTYGATSGGITFSSRIGNISSISVVYNNGGSPAYTIDVTVNYTGATPTIFASLEGISNDGMYLVN